MYHLFFLKFSHLLCEIRYDIFKPFNGARIHNFICVRCVLYSLVSFSSLKLSGNNSKCHYYCSKNGVGIIILSFKKSTYLLLWRSFAESWQHYFALWPRLIVHINLPTRELRLCWQSLRASFSAALHKRFAPLRLLREASQLVSIHILVYDMILDTNTSHNFLVA
jgi:hypothetical protein